MHIEVADLEPRQTRRAASAQRLPTLYSSTISAAASPTAPATRSKARLPSVRYAPLYWLALGSFAVGTESFMIAAILPSIASDLSVGLQAAGQLMAVFALAYAISSPVLTALTGAIDRRRLLIASMAAFTVANVIAAAAPGYDGLLAARILLAVAAGLYVPNANALAGALVPPERRGRALAIVGGGISVAMALGVPLGAVVGAHFGWRMTFAGVAALATLAFTGLLFGLPRGIGAGLPTTTLWERLAVIRHPAALSGLLVTTLWALGGYTVYTYIAPLLTMTAGLDGARIGYALFLWGASAALGLFLGGVANDRLGGRRVISIALPLMAVALISLSISARYLTLTEALIPVSGAMVVWGLAAWAFFPAQQTRLIGIIGVRHAPIILSLNAAFMYLGFSLGALLGSATLAGGTVADLGWVGGLCVLASFALFLITDGQKRTLA